VILSLDSLSVYKDINIASAKPTIEERDGIIHFGIDKVYPNEKFDVVEFIQEYNKSSIYAKKHNKNLIIVGGTGFYLKAMIDGISYIPQISKEVFVWVDDKLNNLSQSYQFLYDIDPLYMQNIASTDRYRIEKALTIYKQTNTIPSKYFKQNPPKPLIKGIQIYEIVWCVEDLRKRIKKRTKQMLQNGLIDEVIFLEKQYSREPAPMNSIGISETLDYLDGKLSKNELEDKIIINTARLAKRQRTFNKSQFSKVVQKDLKGFYDYWNLDK